MRRRERQGNDDCVDNTTLSVTQSKSSIFNRNGSFLVFMTHQSYLGTPTSVINIMTSYLPSPPSQVH